MLDKQLHRGRWAASGGFTLIELLVVVAIIALLISILLPSLAAARDQAKTAACLSHLRSAGLALNLYTHENRQWLPGPNTSGRELTSLKNSYVFKNTPTEPTQNMDWISPLLGREFGMPRDRGERMRAIFNLKFKCPANNITYNDIYNGDGSDQPVNIDPTKETVYYSSYSATLGFQIPSVKGPDGSTLSSNDPLKAFPEMYNTIAAPLRRPRLEDVGSGSDKVFAMDGARYVSSGVVTFNPFIYQIRGGNFMDLGPGIHSINGTPYGRDGNGKLTADALKYGYRHRGKLNAMFFDAHAETLGDRAAAKIDLYFPSGSKVTNAANTADPTDTNGYILK